MSLSVGGSGEDDSLPRLQELEGYWESLLPAGYKKILKRAVEPVSYSSKKELFQRLQRPLLIDGGTKSFVLDMATRKKSFMLSARELYVAISDPPPEEPEDPPAYIRKEKRDIRPYWFWHKHPASRFMDVAHLVDVCWFYVSATIKASELSQNTKYGFFLVFKLNGHRSYNLTNLRTFVSTKKRTYFESIAHIHSSQHRFTVEKLETRADGWNEIYLGEYFAGTVGDGEWITMGLTEIEELYWKRGMILEGIEIRPKTKT